MPRAAQGDSEMPEPTHSETRPRQAGEAIAVRASRASVRPSAFGVPRSPYSSRPPPAVEPAAERAPRSERAPAAPTRLRAEPTPRLEPALAQLDLEDDEETETRPALPRIQNERSRVVDQLTAEAVAPAPVPRNAAPAPSALVLPAAPTSLPIPPVVTQSHAKAPRARRPWGSIALFSGMLVLSVVPLLRYAGSHDAPSAPPPAEAAFAPRALTPIVTSVASNARAQEVAERTETEAAALREQQLASLLAAANRALDADAIAEAERLFARVIELDEDNSRAAYGLARIRLAQGNLSGAEGWIQLALRKRPKRRAYHALYAELLTRLGRADEARDEQQLVGAPELKEADEDR